MKVSGKGSRSKESADVHDTMDSIPRHSPKKIIQKTIKHNYQQLTAIPSVSFSHNIRHLYLSHNHITSLRGIQNYTFLTSFNLSYNHLSKITQLRLILYPQNIVKAGLRMNAFELGYEDYAVAVFPNLSRLDDQYLQKQVKKIEHFKMREFISNEMINFYKKANLIIRQLQRHGQVETNKENEETFNRKQASQKQDEITSRNNLFFNQLKDIYFQCSDNALRLKSMPFLLSLCYKITNLIEKTDLYSCQFRVSEQLQYIEGTLKNFKDICDQILLRFSAKHDKTLPKYLQATTQQHENYIDAFARLGIFDESQYDIPFENTLKGGALKHDIHTDRHSKCLERKDNQVLKNHKMYRLANYQEGQYNKILRPFQQGKWHHFYEQEASQKTIAIVYQRVPILIYSKEYLEVIASILMDKIAQILHLQNKILNYHPVGQTNKYSGKPLNDKLIQGKGREILIQDKRRMNKLMQSQKRNLFEATKEAQVIRIDNRSSNRSLQQQQQENKKEGSEQNGPNRAQMLNGNDQYEDSLDLARIYQQQQLDLNLTKSQILSFGLKQQQPIISLEQQFTQNKMKPSRHAKVDDFKKTKLKQRQKEYFYNIDSYSVYEINLAFKTLRALKSRVKRRKEKIQRIRA